MSFERLGVNDQPPGTNFRVLVVPGFHGSGDAHWQTWLEQHVPAAQRVTGVDWERPIVKAWARAVVRALDAESTPTVVVAHSFGCLASAMAIAQRPRHNLAAVFVAPAQPFRFAPFGLREDSVQSSIADSLPSGALEVPGILVGSQNDPWMKLHHAQLWARRWALAFHDAGRAGHINIDSGFGPWPWISQVIHAFGRRLTCAELSDNAGHPQQLATFSNQVLL